MRNSCPHTTGPAHSRAVCSVCPPCFEINAWRGTKSCPICFLRLKRCRKVWKQSVYVMAADNGSNFKIASCQYVYNLSASALGVGTYRADIKINGTVIGNAIFQLKQAFCCCPQTAATCNKPSRFETRGGFSF